MLTSKRGSFGHEETASSFAPAVTVSTLAPLQGPLDYGTTLLTAHHARENARTLAVGQRDIWNDDIEVKDDWNTRVERNSKTSAVSPPLRGRSKRDTTDSSDARHIYVWAHPH